MAVAVMRGGEVLARRGYGLASIEHAVPVTPATWFRVASVTKQFTVAGCLMLARDGRLALFVRRGYVRRKAGLEGGYASSSYHSVANLSPQVQKYRKTRVLKAIEMRWSKLKQRIEASFAESSGERPRLNTQLERRSLALSSLSPASLSPVLPILTS